MTKSTLLLSVLALCLFSSSAGAKPPPVIGDPQAGPAPRTAGPLILVYRALNPRDYAADGPLTGGLAGWGIGAVSDSLYRNASVRAAEAVRARFPALAVERELRAAFRCGEPASLCTEMLFLPESPNEPLGKALISLLRSHQWQQARLLSFWWYVDEPRLSAHIALEPMQLMPEDKLKFSRAALVGYYWTAPPAATAGAKNARGGALPHVEEWEPGAAAPREPAILAGIADLERLMQFALSWNANNTLESPIVDARGHVLSRPQFRKVDEPGRLECTGMRQCNELVEGVVGDRVWVWDMQRLWIYELQSRPRIAP
jgi:hypothetical protein